MLCICSCLFTFILSFQFYSHIRSKLTAYFFDPPCIYANVALYIRMSAVPRSVIITKPPLPVFWFPCRTPQSFTESAALSWQNNVQRKPGHLYNFCTVYVISRFHVTCVISGFRSFEVVRPCVLLRRHRVDRHCEYDLSYSVNANVRFLEIWAILV